jgi:hypothetical protein
MDIRLIQRLQEIRLYEEDLFPNASKEDVKQRKVEVKRREAERLAKLQTLIQPAVEKIIVALAPRYGEGKFEGTDTSEGIGDCRVLFTIGSNKISFELDTDDNKLRIFSWGRNSTINGTPINLQIGTDWRTSHGVLLTDTNRVARAIAGTIERSNLKTKKLSRACTRFFMEIQSAAKVRDLQTIKDLVAEIEKEQVSRV